MEQDFDYGPGFDDVYGVDDAKLDRWNDGALDALRGKAKASDDADYLEGYADGERSAHVVVVMPRRPEGYYHMPLGTFD